jgi:antitoxin component of MazEF toxin-antitoxin module
MYQTIGKWGNNLAIRIPSGVTYFKKGQLVEVLIEEERIQIVPVKRRRKMAELLASETKNTHPGEMVDFGPDVGGEAPL